MCVFEMGVHVGRGEGGKGERARGGGQGEGEREGERGRRGQRKWGRDFVQNGFVCI